MPETNRYKMTADMKYHESDIFVQEWIDGKRYAVKDFKGLASDEQLMVIDTAEKIKKAEIKQDERREKDHNHYLQKQARVELASKVEEVWAESLEEFNKHRTFWIGILTHAADVFKTSGDIEEMQRVISDLKKTKFSKPLIGGKGKAGNATNLRRLANYETPDWWTITHLFIGRHGIGFRCTGSFTGWLVAEKFGRYKMPLDKWREFSLCFERDLVGTTRAESVIIPKEMRFEAEFTYDLIAGRFIVTDVDLANLS